MKKLLTLLYLVVSSMSQAQNCTIDYTQTQVGIYPNSLPTGTVGQPYSQDLTFVMPTDTLGYDFTNFHILSVALPVGLSWACNNNNVNCDYNPQVSAYGCVHISGTPLLAGTYNVEVTVLADLTILSGYPFVFQLQLEILPSSASISNNGFNSIGAPACAPALVHFSNNHPGLLHYTWDFGNGNISYAENPSAQYYPNPGTYLVQYTAYANLDTNQVYTLNQLMVTSMSNYGGGFPSFENADAYFKILENGNLVYQSTIIGNQNPPVQWTLNLNLNPNSSYVIEIWEADNSYGEPLFGADDYMGSHPLHINGCIGCGAGTSIINYTTATQQILPTPQTTTVDTIVIYALPPTPLITYDSLLHTLSTPNLGFAYQWYYNGSPVAGANAATHVVYQSGAYSLVAVNPNGCVAFSDTLSAIYCSPFLQAQLTENNGTLVVSNTAQNASFTWSLDGQILPNQQGNTLAIQENGNYQCIVTDAFGCTDTTNLLLIEVGVASNTAMPPEIFPNPAKDFLNISLPSDWLGSTIEIIDLFGKVVFIQDSSTQACSIPVNRIQSGTYLIQFTKQNKRCQKLIFISSSN
jgi:hypothetical protein